MRHASPLFIVSIFCKKTINISNDRHDINEHKANRQLPFIFEPYILDLYHVSSI
jgi:hypothetical protein